MLNNVIVRNMYNRYINEYINEFRETGFMPDFTAIEKFSVYLMELMEAKINITSHVSPVDIIRENFLDSLSCLQAGFELADKKIIDIGTGGGFPGLPLKIVEDTMSLHLLEATGKKVEFLKNLIDRLSLDNVYIHQGRAEDFGQNCEFREKFDVAFARAVAGLPVLLEYVLPFVKTGGIFIAQKGKKYSEEIDMSAQALKTLGGEILDIKPVRLPYKSSEKRLIVIKKISATPLKYPRRNGIPLKRPLG
ncbi:MAG: 16S rRNA (guanine(527)-N(7))-methyltransferase RsmG [Candidatus Eremiobacterota bacterium]